MPSVRAPDAYPAALRGQHWEARPAALCRGQLRNGGPASALLPLTLSAVTVGAGLHALGRCGRHSAGTLSTRRRHRNSRGGSTERGASSANPFAEAELRVGAGAREAAAERGCADAWAEASASVADACAVEQELADAWLAKAFGWSLWISAGKPPYLAERAVVPCPQQLREDIRWLVEGPLSLASSEKLRHVVESAPRAALRRAKDRYRKSLASAPDAVRDDFEDLVLSDPKVLELEWDCEGSCSARCAVCWRVRRAT